MGSPLFLLRDEPQLFVAFVIAVIVGITFHEFSHAAVASLQGDQTARSQGRLTLNPIVAPGPARLHRPDPRRVRMGPAGAGEPDGPAQPPVRGTSWSASPARPPTSWSPWSR